MKKLKCNSDSGTSVHAARSGDDGSGCSQLAAVDAK